MEQKPQQYNGPDRRLSPTVYQGGYERRKPEPLFDETTLPPPPANRMTMQERQDEQDERTRQQQEKPDDQR
jgi:hypothetical protein